MSALLIPGVGLVLRGTQNLLVGGAVVVGVPAIEEAVVVAESPTGGWWDFSSEFELALRRREKRLRDEEEAEESAQRIKDETDREIAQLLQEQERKDEERKERERLQSIASRYAGEQATLLYGERLATAMQRAAEKGTYSAIEAFVREAKRAKEEEAFAIRAAIMVIELNG